jgi:hypothetical protein
MRCPRYWRPMGPRVRWLEYWPATCSKVWTLPEEYRKHLLLGGRNEFQAGHLTVWFDEAHEIEPTAYDRLKQLITTGTAVRFPSGDELRSNLHI